MESGQALLSSLALAQTHPRTLSVVPLPTGTLTNGSLVTVEVFVTNIGSAGDVYKCFFCDVPAGGGGTDDRRASYHLRRESRVRNAAIGTLDANGCPGGHSRTS